MDDSAPKVLPAFLQASRGDIRARFIDLEWKQRNMLADAAQSPDSSSPWLRPSGEEVARRNRYANIDPYEKNRVKLRLGPGEDDYINASRLVLQGSGGGMTHRFIATQGPLPNTVSHFWTMVWQSAPAAQAVIVMLTQTFESGREKCFQYYPLTMEDPILTFTPEEDGFDGTVELKEICQDPTTRSEIRKFVFTVSCDEMVVWHYLFTGWPDFLVPEDKDRAALVELAKASAKKAAESPSSLGPRPRIVHCSAGVGRSGTFIALDYLLSELDRGALDCVPDEDDIIMDTVGHLREQRMMMVQGEPQFNLLYSVLKEKWQERNGAGSAGEI